jgi:hypothetical protein
VNFSVWLETNITVMSIANRPQTGPVSDLTGPVSDLIGPVSDLIGPVSEMAEPCFC